MSAHRKGGPMGRGLGVPGDRPGNRRKYDEARRILEPWRKWYKLPTWYRIRRNQLKAEPHCRMCKAEGRGLVVATVCDHVEPHRGIWAAFFGGPFQSLCVKCHDRHKQRDERAGFSHAVGEDGWPVDQAHPSNAFGKAGS